MPHLLLRELPLPLRALGDLALDLRWTWNHATDALWSRIDPVIWRRTRNPWLLLQNISPRLLDELAGDAAFLAAVDQLQAERNAYLTARCGWDEMKPADWSGPIAYFSMEYGIGSALPIYSGGLGILAGDHLKSASDLGVPIVGVGLLYQSGYFRQVVDAHAQQIELYPANLPHTLPILALRQPDGSRLVIDVPLPGRTLRLLAWRAQVGRVPLYLLDSNDPLNSAADRGITGQLYGGGKENRLAQEIVLGIGGWRLLEALGIKPSVCHLNEGHAALVTLERARAFMRRHQVHFWDALWATRAGNVFTTHTPVAAAFDTFPVDLLAQYGRDYSDELGLPADHLLALGRVRGDADEPFNMAFLAARTCGRINGVSALHGEVSRGISQHLYPRWPRREVPIGHVTNGVHMPTWDSSWSDQVWTEACGKQRWRGEPTALKQGIDAQRDETLWDLRSRQRSDLVGYARTRLHTQLAQHGADERALAQARDALDPNVLTVGFARRFTEYKRPTLLLSDPQRLVRLLSEPARPMQLIVAGKAHPQDTLGKTFVRAWAEFARRPEVRMRVVFLEDYDMDLAAPLVQGVDVWINTPRRAWEACGTSGMKVLVNGGLNLSELDGWWAEAYQPDVGWVLNHGDGIGGPEHDAPEAEQLYALLERQIVPEFYARDQLGIPRRWIARMRASMAQLTPQFSANRMMREYVRDAYLPAAAAYAHRAADTGTLARKLRLWEREVRHRWPSVQVGPLETRREDGGWRFTLPVYLGELSLEHVAVQMYAEPTSQEAQSVHPMRNVGAVHGAANAALFETRIVTQRPATAFTARLVAQHPAASVPLESNRIFWVEQSGANQP